MWTRFKDMYSGGGTKEKWDKIFIEAPKQEAITIFYNRFGHNPYRVSCTCCGTDYSTNSEETLEQSSGYDRNCLYSKTLDGYLEEPGQLSTKYQTVEEYAKNPDVLVLYAKDIKPDEYEGDVPEEGYVWK